MCPSYIGILDIQSWWEVPSIAHFCSLFRAAFNLLDFDIEELEEALLTDGTEECASSLLTELIVRLLRGCLGNNDITASNYQMFLRRLFRQKCQETGHSNIFNADIDFQFLPLRRKVQILQALCDFRLAADDVFDLLKNLEAESLRVEPLGWDDNTSAYWYFYGTRLYREDYVLKNKGKKKKNKDEKKCKKHGEAPEIEEKTERVWQVICFTEADWIHLTEKFKGATSRVEKDLYLSLSENFLPEIPRLFQEKERLRRKRLLESMPRRTSSRVQTKKQKEEEDNKPVDEPFKESEDIVEKQKRDLDNSEREHRARQRELKRSQSCSSRSEKSRSPSQGKMVQFKHKKKSSKKHAKESDDLSSTDTMVQVKPSGRQTNNSLACVTGQILIPEQKEQPHSTRKKVKSSQIFGMMEEDVKTDMYKVLEQLKNHEDAWPFMDPVEEDYAPNYYSVIRRPMDLQRMEDRLDQGYYTDFSMFQFDFNLIVKNCRLYNGQDNEYTEMADNLEAAFNRLAERYFDRMSSSDEEIAVEYPIRNPPKRKNTKPFKADKKESSETKKRKHKSSEKSDDEDMEIPEEINSEEPSSTSQEVVKKEEPKESIDNEKSDIAHSTSSKSKHKVDKHDNLSSKKKKKKFKSLKDSKKKHKDKHTSKKSKEKKKHSKHGNKKMKKKKSLRRSSVDSLDMESETSSQVHRSKDSINSNLSVSMDAIFQKDKYDKIKERHRNAAKMSTEQASDAKKSDAKDENYASSIEKTKNSKLKETIEKLKAKSEKSGDTSVLFDDYFPNSHKKNKKKSESEETAKPSHQSKNKSDEYEFTDDLDSNENKSDANKANQKKSKHRSHGSQSSIKNESATEAWEQAVKDINNWLGDTPKLSEFSSNSNSPSQISDEYLMGLKPEDDVPSHSDRDKSLYTKKDVVRRKLLNKEISKAIIRRKEILRTIDRLQPGKAKGNLISNIQSLLKQEDVVLTTSSIKGKESKSSTLVKTEEAESPKLSLGTVLDTVGFGIENQHNFNSEAATETTKVQVVDTGTMTVETENKNNEKSNSSDTASVENKIPKVDEEPEKEESVNLSQEKATPNLSAWFKAFGAPKSGVIKKKSDDADQEDSKSNDVQFDTKNTADNLTIDQPSTEEAVHSEGGESPIPNLTTGNRPRRTSTGSSVSERSSFSQDLDSPRHQPPHTSPLLRSPASPRMEDHQKNLYPPMNGTVRVGFYQDTASVKSSPEKSCSPREAPQSPYAAYSQHVYAVSSNATQLTNQIPNNYNDGSSKSPLPSYGPSYYDTTKTLTNKSTRSDDYPSYNSESLYKQPASPLPAPFSPAHSTYAPHSQHSPYSHSQHSPQTYIQYSGNTALQSFDSKIVEKSSMFPVKKRSYTGAGHISNTSSIPAAPKLSTSDENKAVTKPSISMIPSSHTPSYLHGSNSTSVIMSASNNPQKLQYANCTLIPGNPDVQSHYNAPKITEDPAIISLKSNKEHLVRDQYADISNIHHSITRKQYDHISMDSLSKPFSDNYSELPKPTHGSRFNLKAPYNNTSDLITGNKPSNLSTDYSNKNIEDLSKPSSADMSYESINSSKLDSINSMLGKPHRELYNMVTNMPFPGMMDLNSAQGVPKTILGSAESNIRYSMDKLKCNMKLDYDNLTMDALKCMPNDLIGENLRKPRSEALTKSCYPEAHCLNLKEQNLSDWKVDLNNKNCSDGSFSGYRGVVETESNMSESGESLQKSQVELRVPMCGVADMSNLQKPESQHPAQIDYSPRGKLYVPKSVDPIYCHSSSLSTNTSSYKTSNCHSPLSLEPSLRNLSSLSQNIDRFKDDRLLSGFQPLNSYEKSIPLAHLYPKNVHSGLHTGNNPSQMFPTPISIAFTRNPLYLSNIQSNMHNLSPVETLAPEVEKKSRSRKKKNIIETPSNTSVATSFHHSYGGLKPQASKIESTLKPGNIVPGSAFNYGPPGGVPLYPEGSGFFDDLRNSSTNPYINPNYMVAAAAVHQRTSEATEKCSKSDLPPAVHPSNNPYRFLTHPQVRPGYPFLSMEASSPLYQQYIQRQEELYRQPGSQMMGIFPSGYSSALGMRQPFDSLNRPPW